MITISQDTWDLFLGEEHPRFAEQIAALARRELAQVPELAAWVAGRITQTLEVACDAA